MPKTYERGKHYGFPHQRMRGKRFEVGDRVRFKADKTLGTVIRSHGFNLSVRDDNGDMWQVTTADVIHTAVVKVGRLPNAKNPGRGRAFYFLGSATSKLAARRIEAKHPGSFIHEKDGRYYVLKPKKIRSNPLNAVPIYGRVLCIEAEKTWSHEYGGKESSASQKYFHDFSTKKVILYGLPDGSLLIKAKGNRR